MGRKLSFLPRTGGDLLPPRGIIICHANPEAQVTWAGQTRRLCGTRSRRHERARYWQQAVNLYPGYAAYERRTQATRIPVLVLTPKNQ